MNIIVSEFMDLVSKRNPDFPKIIAEYPKIQVDIYEWTIPFKEGGIKQPDEITLRAGTIYNEFIFTESYIKTLIITINNNVIISELTKKLKEKIRIIKYYGKGN